MDESNVDWSKGAIRSIERLRLTKPDVMHGINHPFGRADDPYIESAFILCATLENEMSVEIHCVSTHLEDRYCVLRVKKA